LQQKNAFLSTKANRYAMLVAFYKPFGVLSQFTSDGSKNRTLAEFDLPPQLYPVGRLDADSEGFLLLSDEPNIVKFLLEPKYGHPRQYWAQVEGVPTTEDMNRCAGGVRIQDYTTRPCKMWLLEKHDITSLPERVPPIRFRQNIPTTWIALELTEGKNRQVRRMTAAMGFPTLRLVRAQIGALHLPTPRNEDGCWRVGAWQELSAEERALLFAKKGA
jgi:23S rRNA pseudouridine2457 synthase